MVEFGITLVIVAVLIIAIWVIIEVKRLRHKIFALFLIALILFTYISFSVSLKGQDIDMTTIPGAMAASKLYVAWLGSVFNNLKSITAQAIGLDWTSKNQSRG